VLYAFELLEHDGADLRDLPPLGRKQRLAQVLGRAEGSERLRSCVPHGAGAHRVEERVVRVNKTATANKCLARNNKSRTKENARRLDGLLRDWPISSSSSRPGRDICCLLPPMLPRKGGPGRRCSMGNRGSPGEGSLIVLRALQHAETSSDDTNSETSIISAI
jgi:hypothetical protein